MSTSQFILSLLAALWLVDVSMSAQTNSSPRRTQRPPLISPELNSDGSVTFRVRAPKASEVKVTGQFGPDIVLSQDGDGVWSGTASNPRKGVHEYRFLVDGTQLIDPQNSAIKPQRWPNTSILHVPSNPPAPWDLQDIPHGVLHEHTYRSKALGTWRRIVVYTPPGSASRKLPVLYLSHGYSDNEASWTVHGKAHWILDSLIASRKSVPMMIVMMDGHALPPGGAFDEYGPANSAALCRELEQDIIPLVESNYRVPSHRKSRAFAGLSMGGHHALTVAMNQHSLFGWVGAFSSAPPPAKSIQSALDHPETVNKDLKLLWIACGRQDFLFQNNEKFTADLKSRGIKHEYVVTEGDHSWPIWRDYLVKFTPMLFR